MKIILNNKPKLTALMHVPVGGMFAWDSTYWMKLHPVPGYGFTAVRLSDGTPASLTGDCMVDDLPHAVIDLTKGP